VKRPDTGHRTFDCFWSQLLIDLVQTSLDWLFLLCDLEQVQLESLTALFFFFQLFLN